MGRATPGRATRRGGRSAGELTSCTTALPGTMFPAVGGAWYVPSLVTVARQDEARRFDSGFQHKDYPDSDQGIDTVLKVAWINRNQGCILALAALVLEGREGLSCR